MADIIMCRFVQEINIFYLNMLDLSAFFTPEVSMAFLVIGINLLVVAHKRMDFSLIFQKIQKTIDCC